VLGGVIVFKSGDIAATFKRAREGIASPALQDLPKALGLQQSFVNTPAGKCFTIGFLWSSDDLELGYQWLTKIEALGDVIHNSVVATTLKEFLDNSGSFIPTSAYGGNCTISVRKITDELVTVIADQISNMPVDAATLFSAHELRGQAASDATHDSVFGPRMPHFVLEFIATSSSPDLAQRAWQWATGFRDAVRKTEPENILPFTYICLSPPANADFPSMYGDDRWKELVRIKKQYDPENVFVHALPQFGSL
jgi:hypothetical protein